MSNLSDLLIFRRVSGLDWYCQVADDAMPARYLMARRIPVDLERPEEELPRARAALRELEARIREGARLPSRAAPNLVDLCVRLTRRWLQSCNFCRWNCRVDRTGGPKHGTCQLADSTRVASYFHHTGEELVFRGRLGSGTIFFTSCNMRCCFCQNGDISTDKENGTPVTAAHLAAMAWQLRREGCHNVNWVGGDPTIHLHTIVEAISLLEADLPRPAKRASDWLAVYPVQDGTGLYAGEANVPMLWNSNFFMSAQAMDVLEVLMDVWLPDFKFGPGPCAVKLARTPWYWETVTGNLQRVHARGDGMVIRHLVMPGHLECCTLPVMRWVKERLPGVPFNLMDQFHPDNLCDPRRPAYQEKYSSLARRVTSQEMVQAERWADELGLEWRAVSQERR
ncbi:MAG: radical SAM protein [Candidatus Eremiobacterota bacterium]